MPRSGHPSKFTLRADRKMLKEVSKNPKMSSQNLQQALAAVDVKVHPSTIKKRLHELTFMGGVQGGNLCSLRETWRPDWSLPENLDKDQDFWNNVLLTDESKIELFGHYYRWYVWRKPNTTFQEKSLIPTVTRTWPAHHHRIHHKFYHVSEGAWVTCEAICKKI